MIDLSDLPTYDPDRDHYGCMELRDKYNDGDYYKVDDVKAALARATPQHPRPTDDELWDATLRDRDQYHEWADKLAEAISKYFDAYIGEHSNTNCPWAEALDAIEAATPQHSVTEQADSLDDTPEVDTLMAEWDADGNPCRCAAFIALRDKARQIERAYNLSQPLASTAATQPDQASRYKAQRDDMDAHSNEHAPVDTARIDANGAFTFPVNDNVGQ